MKVLWVVNIAPPEYATAVGAKALPLGGWLSSMSERLSRDGVTTLSIAFPVRGEPAPESLRVGSTRYLPFAAEDSGFTALRKAFVDQEYDLVHVHGTELPHSLVALEAANLAGVPSVLSVQGLVSVIAQHLDSTLPGLGLRDMTVRSLIRQDSVRGLVRTYRRRGMDEIRAMRLTRHIIGRTEWDRACCEQLAPYAAYHHVDEVLRTGFYSGEWSPANVTPHRIFMSQGSNPLKGLHHLIKAGAILRQDYPNLHIVVSGKRPVERNIIAQRFRGTQYGTYLRRLVRRLNMQDCISFLGYLSEEAVKEELLRSNVFVSASSIENSSNSLGEAKCLGVPSVASYVGGVPSLLQHGRSGFLYQHDAPYMLAHFVGKVFSDPSLAGALGRLAKEEALRVHDPERNLASLKAVYSTVVGGRAVDALLDRP